MRAAGSSLLLPEGYFLLLSVLLMLAMEGAERFACEEFFLSQSRKSGPLMSVGVQDREG